MSRNHVLDYKLADVPELNYFTSDKPYPRGELLVKVRNHVRSYLKNPAATSELLDAEGYIHTGDIVEERGLDQVVWIDRKKNILKLSQGEFVRLWRLESLFTGGTGLINQIYLYGSSLRSYLLAVVVPNRDAISSKISDLSSEAAIRKLLLAEINAVAKQESLYAYEVPRDVIIEWSPFTKENGLLTESGKQMAGKLKARYGEQLEQLYQNLEDQQLHELANLRSVANDLPLPDKILKALGATLGKPERELDQSQSFLSLGGDSLNAVQLSVAVESLCGVLLPVGLILNPAITIKHLLDHGSALASGQNPARLGQFHDVHGLNPDKILAKDLTVDHFFSKTEVDSAAKLATPTLTDAKIVLLTGANGFLGRFLALELATLLGAGAKVYAVVRATSDAAAQERLLDATSNHDDPIQRKLRAYLERGRIIAIAGDLMQPHLGFAPERWESLSNEVDTILHNGALVNHAFSYEQLYEPNVLGTAEMIRFAIHARKKAITFISSVGVASYSAFGQTIVEEDLASKLCQELPLIDAYAAGYGASKWAAEILLEDAQRRFNLPIASIRCGMILAHSEELGQINTADFFTRLINGLIYTGIAPASFYSGKNAGSAHFDGLPVNLVAGAIANITIKPTKGYAVYHCVNDHWDDGISLDTVASWIQSAGFQLAKINDYQEWYQEFGERLKSLTPEQQAQSPLPILYQWQQPIDLKREIRFTAANLKARLAELKHAPRLSSLDEGFLHHCFKGLQQLGLIADK